MNSYNMTVVLCLVSRDLVRDVRGHTMAFAAHGHQYNQYSHHKHSNFQPDHCEEEIGVKSFSLLSEVSNYLQNKSTKSCKKLRKESELNSR